MKKNILLLILVFAIVLSNVYAESTPSSWAKNDVEQAILDEYVPQKLQSNYQKVISREEFCELAVSMLESAGKMWVDITQLQNPYCDTQNTAVIILDRMYIVDGKDTEAASGKKIFEPYASITREEAAKILNLLMDNMYDSRTGLCIFNENEVENAVSCYADNSEISEWAKDYVGQITVRGMMNGIEGNRFDPQGIYTVEQSIVTMSRIYNYSYNKPWTIEISNISYGHAEHSGIYLASDVKGFTAEIKKDNDGRFFAVGENVEHLCEIGIENDPYYGGVQFRFSLDAACMQYDQILYNLLREMCTYHWYMFEHVKDNTEFANEHMKIYINGKLMEIKEVWERGGNGHRDYYLVFYEDIIPDEISTISLVCE